MTSFKKALSLFALAFCVAACGGSSPDTPDPVKPDPVKPTPEEPQQDIEKNRYYFTQAYVGLFAGESAETELRLDGKKYDLAGNADNVTFSSDDPSIATVDAKGKITGIKVGHTVINAIDKNKASTEIYVRVYPEGFLKYKSPAGNDVPIIAWFTKLTSQLEYNTLRQCGFNMATSTSSVSNQYEEFLVYAKNAKVKLILDGLDPATHIDCPGLGMYFRADEPATDNATLQSFRSNIEYYNKVDPGHPVYINFSWHECDDYVKILENIPLNFLSYDHYCIRDSGLRSEFYIEISDARKAANIMAVPFWAFTNSTEHKDYPRPTIDHLRFQLFADMVCGAQAYQFFTYSLPMGKDADMEYKVGPLDSQGNTTDIYFLCQQVIGEIKNYMQFLHGAQNIWIMGNADSCFGKYDEKDLPYPLTSVKSSGQYIISHSCNEGHEYLLVFNASYKQSNSITLNFKDKVQRIGDMGSLSEISGATTVSLSPGNIAIFKLN